MSEGSRTRLFTAEKALKSRVATVPARPAEQSVDAKQVLNAIEEVKALIMESLRPPPPRETPEMSILRGELHELRDSIDRTKYEIAAVRHPGATDDRLLSAAMELDAIVRATEEATNNILGAAEEIDEVVEKLKDRIGDVAALELLQQVGGLVSRIFENCNFQDITGQRTGKVVRTLNYIEERVIAMIDIWGEEEFTAVAVEEEALEGDAALLQGPQLENQGVSQSDIDALFG